MTTLVRPIEDYVVEYGRLTFGEQIPRHMKRRELSCKASDYPRYASLHSQGAAEPVRGAKVDVRSSYVDTSFSSVLVFAGENLTRLVARLEEASILRLSLGQHGSLDGELSTSSRASNAGWSGDRREVACTSSANVDIAYKVREACSWQPFSTFDGVCSNNDDAHLDLRTNICRIHTTTYRIRSRSRPSALQGMQPPVLRCIGR